MIRSVNFGPSRAGLATVGYRLRASDGTYSSRITDGVVEEMAPGGGGTGIYWADVDESGEPASIVWDTGETPPRVAVADLRVVLGGEQAGQLAAASEGGGLQPDERAKLMSLGHGEIRLVSPIGLDQSVTIRRARDYHAADGRALEWVNAGGTWPDLTGAAFAVLVAHEGSRVARFSFPGEVIVPTGVGQTLRLELSREQLSSMANEEYAYEGKATLASGRVIDLPGVAGSFNVLLGRDDPAA